MHASQTLNSVGIPLDTQPISTEGTITRGVEGPKLKRPLTAHTTAYLPLFWVVVYILDEYKFFHQGDFQNSTKNLSKTLIFSIFKAFQKKTTKF